MEIQAFLGLEGHYRWYIKEFAFIAQPLHKHLSEEDVSRKSEQVVLTEEVLGAFEKL